METKDKAVGGNGKDANWLCECGRVNFGNFCVACGKPRPVVSAEQEQAEEQALEVKEENNSPQLERPLSIEDTQQMSVVQPTKATSSEDKSKSRKNAIIAAGIVISLFACIALGVFLANMSGKGANEPQAVEENVQENKENNFFSIEEQAAKASELSINGLDLGADIEKMHALFGQERSLQAKGEKQYYQYDDVRVVVNNNVVIGLVSESAHAYSKRGLHEGATLQDVRLMYGDNFIKSKYENLELYEYKFTTVNNKDGLLRFAFNKGDDKVQYISARMDEKASANKPTKAEAQNPAIQVLYNYHANITNKKYREAYDCLSENFKKRMSYEGWVPGFKTTVSSVPSDVMIYSQTAKKIILTFNLRAVDNPGGTRDFSGTAEVINTKNGWKIDKLYHNLK
ncbi:hypothetical protein [Selenomonas sp. AB3002]|uniref:hypothetical protein n=1 Tax=Selenomonas sp. AB3002 TaxID=1392502 RepID=UPI0004953781